MCGAERMAGQEVGEMLCDADRPHARPAAAVGDAEGFVQIEMADIGADGAGAGEADLGVHVGAVHVNLAAVAVDDLADFLHVFLEHAMRRGIGDHQRGQIVLVLLGFEFQIGNFDAAVGVASTGTTFMPATTALEGLVPCAETGIRQTLR